MHKEISITHDYTVEERAEIKLFSAAAKSKTCFGRWFGESMEIQKPEVSNATQEIVPSQGSIKTSNINDIIKGSETPAKKYRMKQMTPKRKQLITNKIPI